MHSIWEEGAFRKTPDLVVVGAGITGLFTALHAKRDAPLRRVVVLERGPHPSGASVKNVGFACFGSPSQLLYDLDTEGEDVALGRVEERWRGLNELRRTLGDGAIGFEGVGGYEVFQQGDPLHAKVAERLDELNTRLRGIFGQDVFSWADDRIGPMGMSAGHMAWNSLEGAVDSGLLMRSLAHKVQGEDVDIRYNTVVEGWEEQADGVLLRLADGSTLKAGQAVIATNGYARTLVPGSDIVPGRGQVVLTSPIPGLALNGTFHMREGFYYFRHYQGRVLLGGARHLDVAGETTMEEGTTALIQDALEEMLRGTILPGQAFRIEKRWSGIMGFRSHGGPAAVEHLSPHVVLAAGLGGIGVAVGIRVGRKAADLVA
ncbi:MAG TPA: FAD-dependent oxidoreductase [Flavobacteriales bacterium]|nr:FAD-dependent oxidoreductase [Flavobacteriales bacterium]